MRRDICVQDIQQAHALQQQQGSSTTVIESGVRSSEFGKIKTVEIPFQMAAGGLKSVTQLSTQPQLIGLRL
jgi:hypothetical protein